MTFRFSPPPRRQNGESIVPMINVVFLLLVFFLMTSQLVPPEPFSVDPPRARHGATGDHAPELFLSATGELGFLHLRGDAALTGFAAAVKQDATKASGPARLRADAMVPATQVAEVLHRLAADGLDRVALIVAPAAAQ